MTKFILLLSNTKKMHNVFQPGDMRVYSRIVAKDDIAAFESGTVHEVYSTFAIARDAEWSGRLFVLDMKETDEEGIGTRISVEHRSMAFVGDEIRFESRFEEITDRQEIITSFKAFCGERLIAEGRQGQKILKRERIEHLVRSLAP